MPWSVGRPRHQRRLGGDRRWQHDAAAGGEPRSRPPGSRATERLRRLLRRDRPLTDVRNLRRGCWRVAPVTRRAASRSWCYSCRRRLLLFTLFVVLPIGEAAWYSGFNWNGFGRPTNWVGFDNYSLRVRDPRLLAGAAQQRPDHRRLAADPVAAGAGAGAHAGGALSRRGGAAHAVLPALRSGRDRHRPDLQLRL